MTTRNWKRERTQLCLFLHFILCCWTSEEGYNLFQRNIFFLHYTVHTLHIPTQSGSRRKSKIRGEGADTLKMPMNLWRGNTFLFHSSRPFPCLCPGLLKGFLSWQVALPEPSTRLIRYFRNKRGLRTPSGRRGSPRTSSRTADANLDCAFVENALVFVVPNKGGGGSLLLPPLLPPGLNYKPKPCWQYCIVITMCFYARNHDQHIYQWSRAMTPLVL